jgi:hypothetical protein
VKLSSLMGHAGRLSICLLVAVLLTSCGGGGGSGSPWSSSGPYINAVVFGFQTGKAPANLPNAIVGVMDISTGAMITDASVTVSGVPLTYNGAATHQQYEGTLPVNPGEVVTLVVTVGGQTYTASAKQATAYPTLSTPASGATWSADSANTVTWSGGAPLAGASYLLGVFDAADPGDSEAYYQSLTTGTTSASIPAYYSMAAGNRDVVVGLTAKIAIPKAYTNSYLWVGGYDSVPVIVSGMPVTLRTLAGNNTLEAAASSVSALAVVDSSGAILTSNDSVTWTQQTSGTSNPLYAIASSGVGFVAAGGGGTILTSSDGATWKSQTSGTSNALAGVAWSATLSKFVAVGVSGTILASADGKTWAEQTSHTSNTLNSVVWSGSQFVAAGESGTILASPDGATWTLQPVPAGISAYSSLKAIAWSGSQFVVVGYNYTPCCSDVILTSLDGVNWTPRSSGGYFSPDGIAWSGTQFVAVGGVFDSSGAQAGGAILTSHDGVAWTQQASGTAYYLNGVIWAGSGWVMAGNGSTILTSP